MTNVRPRLRPAAIVAFIVIHLGLLLPTSPAAAQTDPEQVLADRYVPTVYLRDQEHECDPDGESFWPAPIESVLGNPDVALKVGDSSSSRTDTIIKMGPVSTDLAGLENTYYLDFPGNPRRPGCTFERDFRAYTAEQGLEPTTYVNIVIDEERNRVVVQYWFWYYFNDWNNLHEGDWEAIQIVFEAGSVEEALESEPVLFGYHQHGGAEQAEPDDDKMLIEDGHPVVFPASGSHASQFGQHLFLGWGENGTGFGCDDTTPPSTAVPLRAVVVPNEPDPNGPFGWMVFQGRWGERQPWEFNGVGSPGVRVRWTDPLPEMPFWRSSSLKVPGSHSLGPSFTGAFCTLTSRGAVVVQFADVYRREILLGTGLVLLAIPLFASRTWGVFSVAIQTFRRNWRTFFGIGLAALPIGLFFAALQELLERSKTGRWLIDWFDTASSGSFVAAGITGSLQYLAVVLIVAPAVVIALREIQQGGQPGIISSFRKALGYLGPIAIGVIVVSLVVYLLAPTLIGLVVAIWLIVRWQFYPQAIIIDGARGLKSLSVSSRAVSGHWWTTLLRSLLLQLLVIVPGPLMGFFLLILLGITPRFANLVSAAVYALTLPIATIGLTLLYQRIRETGPVERPSPQPEGGIAPTTAR